MGLLAVSSRPRKKTVGIHACVISQLLRLSWRNEILLSLLSLSTNSRPC